MFRRGGKVPSVLRIPSVDSRGVQTDENLEKTSFLYKKPQIFSPSAEGVRFKWVLQFNSNSSLKKYIDLK